MSTLINYRHFGRIPDSFYISFESYILCSDIVLHRRKKNLLDILTWETFFSWPIGFELDDSLWYQNIHNPCERLTNHMLHVTQLKSSTCSAKTRSRKKLKYWFTKSCLIWDFIFNTPRHVRDIWTEHVDDFYCWPRACESLRMHIECVCPNTILKYSTQNHLDWKKDSQINISSHQAFDDKYLSLKRYTRDLTLKLKFQKQESQPHQNLIWPIPISFNF